MRCNSEVSVHSVRSQRAVFQNQVFFEKKVEQAFPFLREFIDGLETLENIVKVYFAFYGTFIFCPPSEQFPQLKMKKKPVLLCSFCFPLSNSKMNTGSEGIIPSQSDIYT